MPRPPRPSERMILALHDAFGAAHDTHTQVHTAVREYEERVGRDILSPLAEAATEHENGE